MKLISRLLRKNTSPARIAGFILSNFIGLAIIIGGLQFYLDSRSLMTSGDSFVTSDYLVVNKKVSSANTWDGASAFTPEEVADLESQPWVRRAGQFTSSHYNVWASVGQGGRGMSTMLFFESVPDGFVDVSPQDFHFIPGDNTVPIIISKDYLALYNFGFAGSAGLPQMSESVINSIPLTLRLSSDSGARQHTMQGRVVGLSNRLNTILVPESFMKWSNAQFDASVSPEGTSRLIVEVSSPGDIKIKEYLDSHGLEVAGDKSASQASFLLKVITGIILAVGALITLLSLFILLLSVSLLMEKNRDKLHTLLTLGYPLQAVSRPYAAIVTVSVSAALFLAIGVSIGLRLYYLPLLEGLGADPANSWAAPLSGTALAALILLLNLHSIRRKVNAAWRRQ